MAVQKTPMGVDTLGKSYKVLVVDDSSTIRRLATQMLEEESFEVCGEGGSGDEAVALYKELGPDVVTLDINMPGMSGIEALEKILEFDGDARIVMVSSEGHRDSVVGAIKIGARGYVVKPFQTDDICRKVRDALDY